MRISDWSSDVCSSDLLAHEDGGQAVAQHALHGGQQLRLVVDHHVVARGIAPLDRVEHVLLVQVDQHPRSEEHTSELQSLMRSSYAVFCLNKKNILQSSGS